MSVKHRLGLMTSILRSSLISYAMLAADRPVKTLCLPYFHGSIEQATHTLAVVRPKQHSLSTVTIHNGYF